VRWLEGRRGHPIWDSIMEPDPSFHGTTILSVRRNGVVAIGGER
jgi:hypothetical protein